MDDFFDRNPMPEKSSKSSWRVLPSSWFSPSLLIITLAVVIAASSYLLTKQDFAAWVETSRDVRIYTYNSITGRVCEVRFDKLSAKTERQCK